jgi:endonuclease III
MPRLERAFLSERVSGEGCALRSLRDFHSYSGCIGCGDSGRPQHGKLSEQFAVYLGDEIILAVGIVAPDLPELDGAYGHGCFPEWSEMISEYRGAPGASIAREVTEGRVRGTPEGAGTLCYHVGSNGGTNMPRGVMPRRPARTGRQDRVKTARVGKGTLARANRGKDTVAAPKVHKKAASRKSAYHPIAPERVAEILKRLDQLYPNVTCALTHTSAWELLVATILSAQSTDVNVNRVTPELFRKYPTADAFAALTPEQLQPDIRSTGFFRNKSKSVVGAAKKVVADFGGQVPMNMPDLLTLPGVARKTANVVLGTWFKIADGVVVDTHVTRIARRLELTSNTDPQKIEQDLMEIIPREKWILFAHQIIWHGRKLCYARNPKCADCPLENICHAGDKTWSTVEVHKSAKA